MNEVTTHIGILYNNIFIGDSHSLKDKRMVLKSLKDKIRSQFNVSVAELDGEDKWQTATLGISMIGTDNRYIDSALQNILSLVDRSHPIAVCESKMEFC